MIIEPTRKCWSLLGRSDGNLLKPFKYGVVVATSFRLLADQLATDSRLKGLFVAHFS